MLDRIRARWAGLEPARQRLVIVLVVIVFLVVLIGAPWAVSFDTCNGFRDGMDADDPDNTVGYCVQWATELLPKENARVVRCFWHYQGTKGHTCAFISAWIAAINEQYEDE